MKYVIGFVIVMLVLFQIVIDPKYLEVLNWLWMGFWGVLFILFFIFVYIPDSRHNKKFNKSDKEG